MERSISDKWEVESILDRDGKEKDKKRTGKIIKIIVFPEVGSTLVAEYFEKPFCGFETSLVVSVDTACNENIIRVVTLNSIYTLRKIDYEV
jgi:hypothetical protein